MENELNDEYLADLINRFANLTREYQQKFIKRIEVVTKKDRKGNINKNNNEV